MVAHSSKSLGKAAARSIGWITFERWGTRLSSFIILIVLGRLLPPADFGVVALASMFVTLAAIFVDQGFSKALIQRRDLTPQHIDTAFWAGVASAAIFTPLIILSAPFLADMMDSPELISVLPWLAVGIVVQAFAGTPAALLQRNFRFKALAVRRLTTTVAGGVAAIVVALAGGGVWSLVAQQLVTAIGGVIALWVAVNWRPGLRFQMAALRELWPIGGGVLGTELTAFASNQADRLLIGGVIGAEALGLYHMAGRIVTIMVELFTSVFGTVSLTMFSRMQDDKARVRAWLYRLTRISSAATIPCFAVAALLAPVLIPFLLGEQWAPSVVLFQILSFLGALNSVASFDRSVLLAAGRARAAFLLTLGQAVLGAVLVILAVPYGTLVIAVAVVSRQYLYWPVRLAVLKQAVGIEPIAYLAQWLRPFVASLVMLAVIYLCIWKWPGLTSSPVLYVMWAGTGGLAIYLLGLRIIHPLVFVDIKSALESFRRGEVR